MSSPEPQSPKQPADVPVNQLQAKLRRLERRDWWLWWATIAVMLLLTAAVVFLSLPALFEEDTRLFQLNLREALRGLVGLVLLFNLHAIYQQLLIKRLRRQLAQQFDQIGRLEVRAEEFQKLAVLDPLTDLHNRRFAEERLAAEIARSQRHGYPLTVVTLDLDNLKQINDRYGHAAGDLALKTLAERLRRAIRGSDLAVRMGGDEFIVLLPECPAAQVEHLLARLTQVHVDFRGQKIPVTFSAGSATYQPGEQAEQLLERADQALYADKRTGKNPTQPITHPL